MIVEAKYILKDEVTARLEALEKKFAHFDTTLNKTDQKIKGFGKAGNVFEKIIPAGGKLEKSLGVLNDIPNLNTGILSSAMGIANPYVLAGSAVVAFGAYTMDAIRVSQEWDKTMAKVNVTAQKSKIELKGMSNEIADMAENSSVEFMQVPEAFNQIISGVGDVNKSMDLLKYALKGAQAGFTDINTVSEAGVNIMNSVGKNVSGAQEVYDVLFATLNKGKGEFKDIADYLPRIIPYSNQLGVSFKETSAMFALMTASGQTTEQTTMLLQNAFTNLADGKKRAKLEAILGKNGVFDDNGKMKSMVDIIGLMSRKLSGLADQSRIIKLENMGFDTQAASAFSVLTQNTDKLKDFVDYINNSSTNGGALAQAVKDSENASTNIDKIHNKWISWKRDWGSANGWWTSFTNGTITAMGYLEKLGIMMKDTWHFASSLNSVLSPSQWFSGNMGENWNNLTNMDTYASRIKWNEEQSAKANELKSKIGTEIFKNRDSKDKNFINQQEMYGLKEFKGNSIYEKAVAKYGKNVDGFLQKYGIEKPKESPINTPPKTTNPYGGMPPDDKKTKASKAHKDKVERDINSISGGGTQVRNVIVNIGKQVEKIEISTTNMQGMDVNKIKKILEDLLVTSVRDAEIALAH